MEQELYNLLSVIVSIVTLIFTVIGLYAVYIQIRKIRETAWSNTHSKLCDQSFELLRFFSDNPNCYDYLYKGKELDENSPDRVFILLATEALANFMEHIILQKDNLPTKQWDVWRRFVYTEFKCSIVVRNFILENREWYSLELLEIADECKILYSIKSK
ncbi:hypothetical protein [Dyadobacter frigoris]|uniref:DUF4760 domain-containing protein n=1 Tax=Dyadobacter frigoris TaxID=2576211 RepID=A0A4U6D9T5_9BACT|nr:hypothetical protein [Dyadobacter frigoris]TKT94292.1 hypothetical protein FDK13_03505 [Dyadobacter frigoris]GLU56626.1 hypothetical protein Dfri01_60870 [Dyadobacter frigoris]